MRIYSLFTMSVLLYILNALSIYSLGELDNGIIINNGNLPYYPERESERIDYSREYLQFFLEVDSLKYKNKNISFVYNDFLSHYSFLGKSFERHLTCGIEQKYRTEIFELYYKETDSTMIIISGHLKVGTVLSEDDEKAFQELLNQTQYRLTFYKVNIIKFLNLIIPYLQTGKEANETDYFKIIRKNYSKYFEVK